MISVREVKVWEVAHNLPFVSQVTHNLSFR